jgi:hypothetical protein
MTGASAVLIGVFWSIGTFAVATCPFLPDDMEAAERCALGVLWPIAFIILSLIGIRRLVKRGLALART